MTFRIKNPLATLVLLASVAPSLGMTECTFDTGGYGGGSSESMRGSKVMIIGYQAHDGYDINELTVDCTVDSETQGEFAPSWDVDLMGDYAEIWIYDVDSLSEVDCEGKVTVNGVPLVMFGHYKDDSFPNEWNDPGSVLFVTWEDEDRSFTEKNEWLKTDI